MPVKNFKLVKNKAVRKEKAESGKGILKRSFSHILSLLSSTDEYPLLDWKKYVTIGYVKRVDDQDIDGKVIEVSGPSKAVWIATPKALDNRIGTVYRWLFFIIKSIPEKQLVLEIQVLDNTNTRRVFKFDTKATSTKLRHMLAILDLQLNPGNWTLLEVDLQNLVLKNYGTRFTELCRIQVHGSCKLLRVYTSPVYVGQEDLPIDYRPRATNAYNTAIEETLARLANT